MLVKVPNCLWELSQIETHQGAENTIDNVSRQICVGQHIIMSHQTTCNIGTTSSWWTHSAQNNQVFQSHKEKGLSVIPSFVIHVLPYDFEGRLSSECLFFGHVKIINKNDAFFTNGRTIVSFSSLLHLAVNGILSLIDSSLC